MLLEIGEALIFESFEALSPLTKLPTCRFVTVVMSFAGECEALFMFISLKSFFSTWEALFMFVCRTQTYHLLL